MMIETQFQATAWEKTLVLKEIAKTDKDILFRSSAIKKTVETSLKRGVGIDMPTVVCIPGQQTVDADGNQIKLVKEPNPADYTLMQRLDRIAWLLDVVPQSRFITILADDDWKYTFPEQYDPTKTEAHQQFLADQIGTRLAPNQFEVITTTDLEQKTSTDYAKVQQELLDKVLGVSNERLDQQPGWIKAVIATAKDRAMRRNTELKVTDQQDLYLKAAKVQIGVVIQGLMLRSLYQQDPSIYLSTYKHPRDFAEEMTLMMASQSKNFSPWVNNRQLPAIYCEQGSAPQELLEKVSEAAAIKRFLLNQTNDKVA